MSVVSNALPGVPDVESPLFESLFRSKNISRETRKIARKLRDNGFAVIDFPEPDFKRISRTIIQALDRSYDWEAWRSGRLDSLRIQDSWRTLPEVKQIACNAKPLKLLSDLYGRRAFPFQTLNFPVGTQQHFHTVIRYSVPFLGRVQLREIVDISTGQVVPNRLNGVLVAPLVPAPSTPSQSQV
jgi:hypothetical protein